MTIDRQPLSHPKLPWSSLALLIVTYATFGWLLFGWTENRQIWLLAAIGSMMVAGIVTYPSRTVSFIFGGLKTDTRAFILIVGASVTSVLLLTWLQFFVDTILLSTAGFLVSLDLKTRGWSKVFSVFSLIGWQLLGLSIGLALHYYSLHTISGLPEYFYEDYWFDLIR